MNEFYDSILKMCGYDEPVFYEELRNQFGNMSAAAFKQNIEYLIDDGKLLYVEDDVYYVPRKSSLLKSSRLNLNKVMTRKYIQTRSNEIIGFISGINFANHLGLTTQTASIPSIVTNATTYNSKTRINIGRKEVFVKKSKVTVTNGNYKLLQVLDLLSEYDQLSEKPTDYAKTILLPYLNEVCLSSEEMKKAEDSYSIEVFCKAKEMRLLDKISIN